MMKVVAATAKDISVVRDLDVKCYFYPVPQEGWAHALVDSSCVVNMVKIGARPIGFSILEPYGENLRIHRLGVIKRFRGLGAAKRLLHRAEDLRSATKSSSLETVIPEIQCLPGDPDDVSTFLKFQGFQATGIKRDFFSMYGRKYDGFIFERGPQW